MKHIATFFFILLSINNVFADYDQDYYFNNTTIYNLICEHYLKFQTNTKAEKLASMSKEDFMVESYLFINNSRNEIDSYIEAYGYDIDPKRRERLDSMKHYLAEIKEELNRGLELDDGRDIEAIKALYSAYKRSYISAIINGLSYDLRNYKIDKVADRLDYLDKEFKDEMLDLIYETEGASSLKCKVEAD